MEQLFDRQLPNQYAASLGREKLAMLWCEYKADAEQKFEQAAQLYAAADTSALRIIFHSLKSSSLIFGLDKFAKSCAKIEEQVLSGSFSGQELFDIKALWQESVTEAQAYFRP